MRQRNQLESLIGDFKKIEKDYEDCLGLFKLASQEANSEILSDIQRDFQQLLERLKKFQLRTFFSGEVDQNDCYLEVHAGAGGTEAQDWAEMILKMYMRWSEKHNFEITWIEESSGEEAGIKSASIRISGTAAYGWLKGESGVHRLVRISSFDSQSRRHTSFASLDVYPVIDETIEINIEEKDLRVDTYRASGAGGQHVNKTDSAVRMTHLPTGIVSQCQNNRSQHRNRIQAMNMLKARLFDLELKKREDKSREERDEKVDIAWGHQIRSYVLHPYQMVKDLRTGREHANPSAVLDGDIDDFLETFLLKDKVKK